MCDVQTVRCWICGGQCGTSIRSCNVQSAESNIQYLMRCKVLITMCIVQCLMCKVLAAMYNDQCARYWCILPPVAMCYDWCTRYQCNYARWLMCWWQCAMIDVQQRDVFWNPILQLPLLRLPCEQLQTWTGLAWRTFQFTRVSDTRYLISYLSSRDSLTVRFLEQEIERGPRVDFVWTPFLTRMI